MINYQSFGNTIEKRKISKYQLIFYWGISSNTLRRMSHNETISTVTLNELCLILNCKVQNIIQFEASEEELQEISNRKDEILKRKEDSSRRKKRHKNKP